MTVNEIVKSLEGKTKKQITALLDSYLDKYKATMDKIFTLTPNPEFAETFTYGFIYMCAVDGSINDKEYDLYKYCVTKLGYTPKDKAYCQAFLGGNPTVMQSLGKQIVDTVKTINNIDNSFVETYANLAACIFNSNGVIEARELDYLKSLFDEDTNNASGSSSISSSSSLGNDSAKDVVLKRMGATFTSDDKCSYLNIGVEISNPNLSKCARHVQVKVIVRDSNSRILETNTDVIDYIDSNSLFYYGVEINIYRGSPANYEVQVHCDDFVNAPENSTFSSGIVLSHYNVDKSSWSDRRTFTGNVKNNYRKKLNVDLYFVFYDKSNNIVGGCNTSVWNLYGNSEDCFEIDLDAYPNEAANVIGNASFDFMDLVD